MKQVVKRFLLAALLAGAMLCAAGCRAGGAPATPSESPAPAGSAPPTESPAPDAARPTDDPADEEDFEQGVHFSPGSTYDGYTDHDGLWWTYLTLDCGEKIMNQIPVQPGDKLSIEVENESGSVDLLLQTESETLYDEKDIQNESCTVEATEEGKVSIVFDGNSARNGHISIEREADSPDLDASGPAPSESPAPAQ